MTTTQKALLVPFTLIAIANIITIATFIAGEHSRYTIAGATWIFLIDIAYAVMILKFELFPRIPVGTKSLLIGAHQILWHPFTVLLARIELYGWPNWKECICIFIHDWGYWGCTTMEGEDGKNHPEVAAAWAFDHLDDHTLFQRKDPADWDIEGGFRYFSLCLNHSRTYAEQFNHTPSKLCWADKLCVKYDPWWFYLFRVWLSGEKEEYRREADAAGLFPLSKSDREWYAWARERMIRKALAQDAKPPYTEGS